MCSSTPFSSGTPLVCHTQALVLHSVQLIHSTRLQDHNSNAGIHFRRTSSPPTAHSFQIHIMQCSTPTNWLAISLVSDRFLPISIVLSAVLHRCQPSRIRRDSPAFSSDVPRSREISRCPAFFENSIIIFFVADYSTCLPRNATK